MLVAEKIQSNHYEFGVTTNNTNPRSARRPQGKLVLVLVMLFLAIIGNMIIQGLVIKENQRIELMKKQIDEKQRELIKLRIEIAGLESFDRIRQIAQNELGMREAGPQDLNLIKAAPSYQENLTPSTAYLAQVPNRAGLWGKISTWFSGIGKTMANNPQ